ncbi:hypothetical protein F4778DRAFT_784164 [Xylariomycetidae sp. FL2044]|nr:hypothetical protein F4778DRAFT_784164 [Xylariomycetidae sp. FL2044]
MLSRSAIQLLISCLLATTQAALDLSTPDSLNRYIPGSVRMVSQTLDTQGDGYLMVGEDGVMRSFASDGTVLDYHQLDPDQLKEFAIDQLHKWGKLKTETPDVVEELAKPPYADGRLVLDKERLLHPEDRPQPGPALASRSEEMQAELISRSEEMQVVERMSGLHERQECIGAECLTLNNCAKYRPTPCYQCYFNAKAPMGACMLQG